MIPLRWRLALWHLGLTALGLLGFIFISYQVLSDSVRAEVDNTLAERANHVADAVAVVPNRPIEGISRESTDEFRSPGIYVQLFNTAGVVVARSFNLGAQQLPVSAADIDQALTGESFYAAAEISGQPVRLFFRPVQRNGQIVGATQVGQSLAGLDATLSRLRLIYSVGMISVLGFSLAGGWMIAHQGLRPVARVIQTARDIVRAKDLVRRVQYSGPADEIGTLATTFNDMLDRLQVLFEGQRRFLAEAAHELRTPLASMLGNVDLLVAFGDDPGRRQETLAALQRTGQHVGRLLEDLLLLAQAEAGWHLSSLAPVALDDVVMEAYEAARLTVGGIWLKVDRCEPARVRGDFDRLRQVFANLIDNAAKHSPPGTAIALSVWCAGGRARASVSDQGRGISSDALPHLFEPFFRAPSSERLPGVGLGLTIVQWTVLEHGGEIEVESVAGQGTTISISLPEDTSQ